MLALAKPSMYSSPAILARRRRILRETRRIIADGGVEKLTMRKLSQVSQVSQYTLYNAFKSREHIIAAAIYDAFDEESKEVSYNYSIDTIDGNIERIIKINARNFGHKNYARAITSLYFSPRLDQDVTSILREMAFINMRPWMDRLEEEGEMGPWIDRATFEVICVNDRYAAIHDWATDRITDEAYLPRVVQGTLLLIAGATTGRTRDRALELLGDGLCPTGVSLAFGPLQGPALSDGNAHAGHAGAWR